MSAAIETRVDLGNRRHKADPFPLYRRLRARSPVATVRLPDGQQAWLVTRYAEARQALLDRRLIKDRRRIGGQRIGRDPWLPRFARPLLNNMLDVDQAQHRRLRSLVSQAFTPAAVASMAEQIHAICATQLDCVFPQTRIDLIRQFALPIPSTVIALMLGVPRRDVPRFTRWSHRIVGVNASRWGMVAGLPSLLAFIRYLHKLVRHKRAHPADDLMTALIHARNEGDQLSDDELMAMAFLLLVAGFETTVNLIGNGMLDLVRHPESLCGLRSDQELSFAAIEELLRFSCPLELATERYASQTLEIAGTQIPRGALVYVAIASANRDPGQFDEPDRLRLDRDPNPHLSFGLGSHYCLGAPLARLEARLALRCLLDRTASIELAVDPAALRWRRTLVPRGLRRLPLRLKWI